MMAAYIENHVVMQSTGAAERNILDIWKDINQDPRRPVKLVHHHLVHNAHANMKWWLESHFPSLRFMYIQTNHEDRAPESIVGFVDGGFPVLVAVSHTRTHGHIILVIGYEDYQPNMSSLDFKLVVHDPYGRFDPSLLSNLFGGKRSVGGMCMASGGESGPGRGVRLAITGVGRHRLGDSMYGTYHLLSASR
jgi:hypothetical protein